MAPPGLLVAVVFGARCACEALQALQFHGKALTSAMWLCISMGRPLTNRHALEVSLS